MNSHALRPVRSARAVQVIAVSGDWACFADVRELHGAADVVRLYDFELDVGQWEPQRFATLEGLDDADEITEALTAAAVEAWYEATDPNDPPEVQRADHARDRAKDATLWGWN